MRYNDIRDEVLGAAELVGMDAEQVARSCEDCGREGFESGFVSELCVDGVERWYIHERRTGPPYFNFVGMFCDECNAARDEADAAEEDAERALPEDQIAILGEPGGDFEDEHPKPVPRPAPEQPGVWLSEGF